MIPAPSRVVAAPRPAVRAAVSLGPADVGSAVGEGPVEGRMDSGTDGVLPGGLAEDKQLAVLGPQTGGCDGAGAITPVQLGVRGRGPRRPSFSL